MQVLLIDDDDSELSLLRIALRRANRPDVDVCLEKSLDLALKRFAQCLPDAVFLDNSLTPDGSIANIHQLFQDNGYQGPIVLYTNIDPGMAEDLHLTSAADYYICKTEIWGDALSSLLDKIQSYTRAPRA